MIETGASKSFAVNEEVEFTAWAVGPLLWLNLLCLDAPLVAVSWLWLFARSFEITIAPRGTAALFLAAWLIYLADRLGDSLSLDQRAPTSLRQQFCRRHRGTWLGAIGLIAMVELVVCARVESRAGAFGLAVGAFALAYLLVNRFRPSLWRTLPLKEISIGFIFAAGTMVPLASGLTRVNASVWLLFACLCSLNCISIAVWERGLDVAQQRISIATVCPTIGRYLLPALLLLVLASLGSGFSRVYLCIAVSAAFLTALHIFRERIQPDIRTALADLVLLTPVGASIFG